MDIDNHSKNQNLDVDLPMPMDSDDSSGAHNSEFDEDAPMPMDSGDSSGVQDEEEKKLTKTMDKLDIASRKKVNFRRKPVIILVVGMMESGKSTLVHRLHSHSQMLNKYAYTINLDPTVKTLKFGASVDIRDTVDYKQVRKYWEESINQFVKDYEKKYEIGPCGGILKSLDSFTTRIAEIISGIEKQADYQGMDYVLVDFPGSTEMFTWHSSSIFITEAFASKFATVVAYVVNTPRSQSAKTFLSTMLDACSILYKTRLPLILAFNKTDLTQHHFALEWMKDSKEFQEALSSDCSYLSTLTQGLSLVLDELHKNVRSFGVSAVSGEGIEAFFEAIEASAEEYMENYKADLDKRQAEMEPLFYQWRKDFDNEFKRQLEKSGSKICHSFTGLRPSHHHHDITYDEKGQRPVGELSNGEDDAVIGEGEDDDIIDENEDE